MQITTRPPKIVVVGSINMDLVLSCDRLPKPGETRISDTFAQVCGGKGANQAAAAARAGGEVMMVGRVGDDAYGPLLRENLVATGVDCEKLKVSPGQSSGLAIVAVEDSGQNSILAVPGANADVSVQDVDQAIDSIREADLILLQLEVDIETVRHVIRIAQEAKRKIILDPAPPLKQMPRDILAVDLVCPNETEAEAIVGYRIDSIQRATDAAQEIHAMGAANVAITLGDHGTVLLHDRGLEHIGPFTVDAVDTTAAGDAFAGALAVFWSQNYPLISAVRYANAAGALAASVHGAQPSLPSREQIESLCKDVG